MPDRGSIICEGCEAPRNRGKDLRGLSGLSSQRKNGPRSYRPLRSLRRTVFSLGQWGAIVGFYVEE